MDLILSYALRCFLKTIATNFRNRVYHFDFANSSYLLQCIEKPLKGTLMQI